jgi:predicted ATPase
VQLFPVLVGLRVFYAMAGRIAQAHDIGKQLLTFAQHAQEPGLLLEAYLQHGNTLIWAGEFAAAQEHFDRALALYDPIQHRRHATLYGQDTRVASLAHLAHGLWFLGYPAQAVQKAEQALIHGQECAHPFSLTYGQVSLAFVHLLRNEGHTAQQTAEAMIALAREQGFPFWEILGTIVRGWALTKQGQREAGIEQMRQGVSAWRAMGVENSRPQFLALLAEAYGDVGQPEEGLAVLAEGLAQVEKTGGRFYEAELYRLKGTLTLQKEFNVQGSTFKVENGPESEVINSPASSAQSPESEAEECFMKAIEIARKQQAKSLELRAVMSLVRLWQNQGKRVDAHRMLSEVYNWFTEGFDTKDLQEAKALLEGLEHKV